jgi:type IV secretory pathway VirB10-like protein
VSVKQDKRARGRIIDATMEIERAHGRPARHEVQERPAGGTEGGPAGRDRRDADEGPADREKGRGRSSRSARASLEVGNRMYVVRRGDAHPGTMSTEVGATIAGSARALARS